jgi:hypothetical protein
MFKNALNATSLAATGSKGLMSGVGTVASSLAPGLLSGAMQWLDSSRQRKHDQSINRENIQFQREALAQNLALQERAWSREDSAVQRRAADLKAAGMNPLMAAGAQAQSSAPIKVDAVRKDNERLDRKSLMAEAAMANAQALQNIYQTKASTEASVAQANLLRMKTVHEVRRDIEKSQMHASKLIDSNLVNKRRMLDNAIAAMDVKAYRKLGTIPRQSASLFGSGLGFIERYGKRVKRAAQDAYNDVNKSTGSGVLDFLIDPEKGRLDRVEKKRNKIMRSNKGKGKMKRR